MIHRGVSVMTLPRSNVITMADVGTFRTTIAIENPLRRGERKVLPDTLVDTGAELTWAPTAALESLGISRQKQLGFRTADGRAVFRDIGYAIVHAGGTETIDEVVFAEPGDMTLLGARSLEGLNLRVDPRSKQLVDAGPIVAAPLPRRARSPRPEAVINGARR
jgi:predicted aspartyl protease